MVRYPKEQKAQTRERIVEAASRAFRSEGIAEVSVPALMGSVGLTHGGFYAHFESKDALAAEACARPLLKRVAELDALPRERATLEAVIDAYVSPERRDNPASSCPLPSLSAEVARAAPEVRQAFTDAFRAYSERLATLLPNGVAERAADQELAMIAGMVGAVVLARAVDDPNLSDRILAATRSFAIDAFTGTNDDAATIGE